jgi:hypothetical protein
MLQTPYRNFPIAEPTSAVIDGLDVLVGGGLEGRAGYTFDATVVVAFETVVGASFAAVWRLLGDVQCMCEDIAALQCFGRSQRNQASLDT